MVPILYHNRKVRWKASQNFSRQHDYKRRRSSHKCKLYKCFAWQMTTGDTYNVTLTVQKQEQCQNINIGYITYIIAKSSCKIASTYETRVRAILQF